MMAFQKDDKDEIRLLEDGINQLRVVTENWITVDKSNPSETSNSHEVSKIYSLNVFPSLKPYVPFPVEELSCTTRLDTWSNNKVRVIGFLKLIDEKYYLESVNEPGGTYKILVVFERMDTLPSVNQILQVFGEITVIRRNDSNKPLVDVLFFRNLENSDLRLYTDAIEHMRRYIPLFFNVEKMSANCSSEDSQYYYYHELNDYEANNDDVYENAKSDVCLT